MALRTLCKGLAWACALTLIGEAKAGHEDPPATYTWIKETWPQVT